MPSCALRRGSDVSTIAILLVFRQCVRYSSDIPHIRASACVNECTLVYRSPAMCRAATKRSLHRCTALRTAVCARVRVAGGCICALHVASSRGDVRDQTRVCGKQAQNQHNSGPRNEYRAAPVTPPHTGCGMQLIRRQPQCPQQSISTHFQDRNSASMHGEVKVPSRHLGTPSPSQPCSA